jgi:hypothetical protein
MDPNAAQAIMLDSDSDSETRSQAACDLYNWVTRGGFPPAGWTREGTKIMCKKYMS